MTRRLARRSVPGLLIVLALLAEGCGTRERTQPAATFEPDSVPDAYLRPTGALMWPGATRAFQVTEAGDLYDGEWRALFEPASDGVVADPPLRIAAQDRWRPALRWVRRNGDVRWEFESVAFVAPAPRESVLVASLQVRARNLGTTPHAVTFRGTLAPPAEDPIFVAWDAVENPRARLHWAVPGARDSAQGWCAEHTEGAAVRVSETLAPGRERTIRLLLPTYPLDGGTLDRMAGVPHERRRAETFARWDQWLAEGTKFDLGDPEVENALRAARVVMLSCRERRGALWVPIGGPFQYRDVWLRDGARLADALVLAGHREVAWELVKGLAAFQWPNGAFLSQRGQLDGTGQALWAFEQVLLRAAPPESLDAFISAAERAWQWIEWQRALQRPGDWPYGAMLPYGDPRDGELVRAQLTGNDAWALAGERGLEHLLRARGRASEADSVARDRARYMADFRAALARTGRPGVPPSWQGVGRDWGNLAACWPCGAVSPQDPRMAVTAARAWAEAGGAGLTVYGHRDSLHDYVGADLGTWALLAGRRAQADSVLAALLHWRTASGTAGELFARNGDFGRNLPPHPTSAAALVTLVRHALLFDEGDTLRLTLGARERWWHGSEIAGALTFWGPVDLEFHRDGDEAVWKWTPVPAWTALTLPPDTRLAGPLAAPLVAIPGAPDRVLAPPGTGEARVRLARGAAGT